jgi:hypothetical protein
LRVTQADLTDPKGAEADRFGTETLLPDPDPIDLPGPEDPPPEDPLGDPETQIADLIF